jgi:hypothetical protein
VGVGVQSAHELCWIMFLGGDGGGGSHVLYDMHLLGLQVYAGSFETSWCGEMVWHFSYGKHLLGLHLAWWVLRGVSMG